MLQITIKY